jgi:exopolysaccharide biosynthesis polyprenyl glycosylphosphotransferase
LRTGDHPKLPTAAAGIVIRGGGASGPDSASEAPDSANEALAPTEGGRPSPARPSYGSASSNAGPVSRVNGWAATHGRRVRSRTSRRSRRNGATGRERIVLTPTVAPRRRSRQAQRYLLVDAVMLGLATVAAVTAAHVTRSQIGDVAELAALSILTLILLAARGMYRPRDGRQFLEGARTIVAASAVAAMSAGFARLVLGAESSDASSAVITEWVLVAAFLIGGRAVIAMRSRVHTGSATVIIGAGQVGHLVARRLLDRPQMGLRPVGFIDANPLDIGEVEDCPVLGSPSQLDEVVRLNRIEHAIVSFSNASHAEELDMLRRLRHLDVSVSVVPRLFEDTPDRMTVERVGGLPLLSIHPAQPKGWQFKIKYGIDRLIAAAAILIVSPVMLVAAIGTLLTIGRPLLFRQRRVGLDGRDFEMLKFRTMREGGQKQRSMADIEEALRRGLGPGGVEGEDRRTRFGTLLRRTAIDELPQLLNVLRGDMSLVGPRPERDHIAAELRESVYRYADRDRVKSGITGWAQVNGLRGRTSLADRVEWDNYYIDNWSLWLDFKIALLTSVALIRDAFE